VIVYHILSVLGTGSVEWDDFKLGKSSFKLQTDDKNSSLETEMKLFNETSCPSCQSENIQVHTTYTIQNGEQRFIYYCQLCQDYFSETKNTPLAGLRTSLSRVIEVIDALNDGMGINAAVRTFKVAKNTLYDWLKRVADLKEPLLL
jgi:transposase-like protein